MKQMPPLGNPRHERFVQALFEGKPANKAYEEAGYKPHDGNCIRLRGNERVQRRLSELQEGAARKSEITVASVCAELDEAIAIAKQRGQASAMVSASALRAKLGGLLVEKQEVQVSNADWEPEPTCAQEVLDRVAEKVSEEAAILLGRAFDVEYDPNWRRTPEEARPSTRVSQRVIEAKPLWPTRLVQPKSPYKA